MLYTGTVTDSRTGLPLSGIRVSDGRNIVITDEKGRYSLPGWERSRLVYVNLLTEERADWFVCTGGNGGVYDFSVTPVTQSDHYCFFHVSDTEINGREHLDWVDFLARQTSAHAPAFLINTGDLFAVEGTRRHAAECTNGMVGCPIRYCIGNHDFTDGDYGEQLFESLYGPTWCSFDLGQLHFVCLSYGKGDKPSGYDPADQFLWLKKDLATMKPDQKLVVLAHNCCADENTFTHRVLDAEMEIGCDRLAAWIFGHMHTAYDLIHNGVHIMCTGNPGEGGIDSSAAGVRKITVSGTSVTSDFICNRLPVPAPGESIWRIKLPGRCEHSQPVLYEDDLFVCTCEYGYTTGMGIYRICGETGEIKWFFNTECGIKGGIDIQDGYVYLQDHGGVLYCLNVFDGSLVWKNALPLTSNRSTRMNVLVRNGIVVAGRPKQIFGCDAKTGAILWTYSHKRGSDTPSMLLWDTQRQQVILPALWYMTAAIDIKTGDFAWQQTEHPANLRNNTPLIRDGILYGCGQNWVYRHELATGTLLKAVQKDFYMDSPGQAVLEGDVLYCGTSEKGVVALDKESFEVLRFYPADPAAVLTAPYIYGPAQTVEGSPVIIGDQLIFAGSDGMLRIYDKHTAALKKVISIGAPCVSTPLLDKNTVYTADFDGYVTKFQL